MEALDAAHLIRDEVIRRYSAPCEDPRKASIWYAENVWIWGPEQTKEMLSGHAATAQAAVGLEGRPDGERGPDCWSTDISLDPVVLEQIPGWWMQSENCSIVTLWPSP